MKKSKKLALGVQVGVLIATLGTTLGVVHLIGGGLEDRNSAFWLTMITILLAEILVFNVPMAMTAAESSKKRSFPFQLTASTFAMLYAIGVFFAAIGFFAGASFSVLLATHLVLALMLIGAMGAFVLAGSAIEAMDTEEKQVRGGYKRLVIHLDSISDRCQLLEGPAYAPVVKGISELKTELEFATGESISGSESADSEITSHLGQIESLVMELEEADEEGLEAISPRLLKEFKLTTLAIQRRETLIKSLR